VIESGRIDTSPHVAEKPRRGHDEPSIEGPSFALLSRSRRSTSGPARSSTKERAMSDYVRTVPSNLRELSDNFAKLASNKSHVKKVQVNLTTGHLEVTLDWAAHNLGNTPDFYLPLKRADIAAAQELVSKMLVEIEQGASPSQAQLTDLYDIIDPSAH
jgi:hypothetical protein